MSDKPLLKEYPYERRRLDYFIDLQVAAERKMKFWEKAAKGRRYLSAESQKASEYGEQSAFLKDVIEMLWQGGEVKDWEPVRHGHWLNYYFSDVWHCGFAKCSLCENVAMDAPSDYCPFCGARMDEEAK